jgi:hypothetical protein
LNNEYFPDPIAHTVTICMVARLAEYMKEHLPLEMLSTTGWPYTPCHPQLLKINLTDDDLSPVEAKRAHRLCAQLIYVVVQIYYNAQYAVFRIARFTSKPSKLYLVCLEHALRHLFATRHIGLTLGAMDEGEDHVSLRLPTEVASHVDAGHAQAGPSTGGYTIDCGTVTVGAVSGQHHAVTLGTTDSEAYECSRAIAALIGAREFAHSIGHAQTRPGLVKSDSSGVIRRALGTTSERTSMYLRRRITFIQQACSPGAGLATVMHVRSENNRADILTKMLAAKLYKKMRDAVLNVRQMASRVHALCAGLMPRA